MEGMPLPLTISWEQNPHSCLFSRKFYRLYSFLFVSWIPGRIYQDECDMPVAPVISRSAQEEAVRQLEFIIAYPNIGVKIIIERFYVYFSNSIF